MCLSVADCNEFFQICVKQKSNLQCGSTPEGLNIFLNSEVIQKWKPLVVSKNFRAKHQFRIRFATAKPCFALQFLPPTSGRNCAATQATPSEVLGWSRANSANAYWTLYTITLAHTILGIWYATLKKTQEGKSSENQTSVERFCNIQTIWVGLGGSRLQ